MLIHLPLILLELCLLLTNDNGAKLISCNYAQLFLCPVCAAEVQACISGTCTHLIPYLEQHTSISLISLPKSKILQDTELTVLTLLLIHSLMLCFTPSTTTTTE